MIDLPPPLQVLVSDLIGSFGMRARDRQASGGFGNCLIELGSDALRIRLVRDRGQWRIEVADARVPDEWFYVEVLRQLLSAEPFELPLPIDDQARYLRKCLPQLLEAFGSPDAPQFRARLAERKIGGRRRRSHRPPTDRMDLASDRCSAC